MDAMSGEKQRIFTFELFGVKWKAKLDSYNPGKAITDLKVVARMDRLQTMLREIGKRQKHGKFIRCLLVCFQNG